MGKENETKCIPIKMYRALLKEISFWSSSLERKEIGANTVKPASQQEDRLT